MISVLYIDDEPDQCEIGRYWLEKKGEFLVETAASAREALAILGTRRFDAIISDYSMPGMDGIDLLRVIRDSGNDIPFLIFTGRGREEVVIHALNEGADFYLQKGGDCDSLYAELSSKVKQSVQRRKTETALRESEEKYRILADTSPEMIYFIDTNGYVKYVNPVAARQFHADPAALTGKHLREIFPGPVAEGHLEAIGTVISDGRVLRKEMTEEFPAGKVWIEVTLSPVMGPEGSIIGVLGLSNDVTSRKRAEREREESENRFRQLFESSGQAQVILSSSGRIVDCNRSFLIRHTPGMKEAVLGQPFESFFPGLQTVEGSPGEMVGEMVGSAGQEGTSRREWACRGCEGRNHSSYILECTRVLIGGDPLTHIAILDTTGLKESEERIRLLAGLIDLTPAAITVHDTAGRFLYANRAALSFHGYTEEELYQTNLHDLDLPGSAQMIGARLEQLKGVDELSFEVEHYRKDRSVFPLLVNARYMAWAGQQVVLSIAFDIERRKRIEQALLESEALFRTLVGTMLDTVLILDWDGTVLFANPAASALVGNTSGEILTGFNVLLFVNEEYHSRVLRDLAEVRAGHVGFFSEYEISPTEGEVRWIEALGTQITFQRKEAALIVVRDITTRKQTEALLQEETSIALSMSSMDSLDRALGHCVPGAIRVSGLDCGGIYLKDPASGTLHLEWSTGLPDQYRESCTDLPPGSAIDRLLSDGRAEYLLYKSLGDSVPDLPKEEELRAVAIVPVLHLGELIGCLMVASFHLLEVPDQARTALEAIASLTGGAIAEARSHRASMESEHRLAQIIDFLPDATFAVDHEGRVIAWNRAVEELTGVPAGRMLGKGGFEHAIPFYGTRRPMLIDLIGASSDEIGLVYHSARSGPEGITGETIDAIPRGRRATLWGKAVTLSDASGKVMGAIESIRDISDHRMLEDGLIQLGRRLNLLSTITRDEIIGSLAVCREILGSPECRGGDPGLVRCYDQLAVQIAAIERQIGFTRLYQDLGLKPPEWQGLKGILGDLTPDGITINASDGGMEVFADPMLPFVFSSLLENTRRHGKTATTVIVKVEIDPSGLTILWEDDGVGIPPENRERIFEREFGEHAGVGLFLCREILGITGIEIHECGEGGRGAKFEIHVPPNAARQT